MKMSWQEKREASSGFISPPHSGLVCGLNDLKEWTRVTSGNESNERTGTKKNTCNFGSGDESGEGGGHSGLHFSREGNRRLSGVASQLVWCHLSTGQKSRSTDWIWFLGGFIVPFKDIQGKRLPFSHGRSKRQPKQGLWSAVKLDLARRGGFTSPLNAARSVGFDARCSPRSELPPGRDQTYDEVLLGVSCTLLKLGLWNFGFDLPSSWHGSNMDEASKHGSSCILWGSFLDWVDWAHFGRDIHGVVQRRM